MVEQTEVGAGPRLTQRVDAVETPEREGRLEMAAS
jgi:hypothetical protein